MAKKKKEKMNMIIFVRTESSLREISFSGNKINSFDKKLNDDLKKAQKRRKRK